MCGMDIKGALIGSGATVLVIAGGIIAASLANASDAPATQPASLVQVVETPEPTIDPTPEPTVTPEPVVTPEPPVEVVVPEPEPVVEPEPAPEPVVVEPAPAPEPEPADALPVPPATVDYSPPSETLPMDTGGSATGARP